MENGKESVYPTEKWVDSGNALIDNFKVKTSGITKREYFAGLAMQGLLSNIGTNKWADDKICKESIMYADMLLEALSKP